jgi:hypothetical protein
MYTTRPNLQKRYHVNKLWFWDQPVCQWTEVENCVFHNLLNSDRLLRKVNPFTTVSWCEQWVYSYCLSQSEHNMSNIIVCPLSLWLQHFIQKQNYMCFSFLSSSFFCFCFSLFLLISLFYFDFSSIYYIANSKRNHWRYQKMWKVHNW